MSCQENRKRGGLIDGDVDLWWCSGKRKEYNGLDRESTKKGTVVQREDRKRTIGLREIKAANKEKA